MNESANIYAQQSFHNSHCHHCLVINVFNAILCAYNNCLTRCNELFMNDFLIRSSWKSREIDEKPDDAR